MYSTQGLVASLQANDAVVKQINAGDPGGSDLPPLADAVDQQVATAKAVLSDLSSPVTVMASNDQATLAQQRTILDRIAQTSDDIQTFQDVPAVVAQLYTQRAAYYGALAETYDDSFAWVITFTAAETAQLSAVLRRADLDAAERQVYANVLDAAVQVSKFILSVLGTVL